MIKQYLNKKNLMSCGVVSQVQQTLVLVKRCDKERNSAQKLEKEGFWL